MKGWRTANSHQAPIVPNPKPQTPNPIHQTPNPKPQTPNPKPQTPNTKPQTPDPRPLTLICPTCRAPGVYYVRLGRLVWLLSVFRCVPCLAHTPRSSRKINDSVGGTFQSKLLHVFLILLICVVNFIESTTESLIFRDEIWARATRSSLLPLSLSLSISLLEGRYKATWKREFELQWRVAGLLKSSR